MYVAQGQTQERVLGVEPTPNLPEISEKMFKKKLPNLQI